MFADLPFPETQDNPSLGFKHFIDFFISSHCSYKEGVAWRNVVLAKVLSLSYTVLRECIRRMRVQDNRLI